LLEKPNVAAQQTGAKNSDSSRKSWFSTSNVVAAVFVIAAGAIAWFGTQSNEFASVHVATETVTLAATAAAADEEDAVPAQPLAGTLPTRLVAPTAGIDTAVAEVGVVREAGRPVWETAWRSAGHHLTSARPGQPGNMVISGHVAVANADDIAVFANLDQLEVGDIVEVHSGDHVFRYQVSSKSIVLPTALQVLRSSAQSRLTLITCTPDLEHRLIVVGTLI